MKHAEVINPTSSGPRSKVSPLPAIEMPSHVVFWRYDQFPYVLGAPAFIDEDNESYYVPAYRMTVAKPLSVMTLEAGQETLTKLKRLTDERHHALASIHEGFAARLREMVPAAFLPR